MEQPTFHHILQRWILKTHSIKYTIGFTIAALVLFNTTLVCATSKETPLWILTLNIAGNWSSLFALFFLYKKLRRLSKDWLKEYGIPVKKLLEAIQCIAAEDIHKVPPPLARSFTTPYHQQLQNLAQGILAHQRYLDHVFDSMFDMMFLLDEKGVIQKTNRAACTTLGYPPAALLGHHIGKIFAPVHQALCPFLEIETQLTLQGMVQEKDIVVQTSWGETMPFSLNGIRVVDAHRNFMGYTIMAKNQTETTRLINELNQTNAKLALANEEINERYDEIKKKIQQKEGERKLLEKELQTSKLVQTTFLPSSQREAHTYIDYGGRAIPATFCGGDWWNVISDKDKFYVFIGDVTGHGTASAMITAAVAGYFMSIKKRILAGEKWGVAQILEEFNALLVDIAKQDHGYNMTCFACLFDFEKNTLTFANAGHTFPLWIPKPGEPPKALIAQGSRLGDDQEEPFTEQTLPLQGGEFFFFYTDGLVENQNPQGEGWGRRRLRKFLTEKSVHCVADAFVEQLAKEALRFHGHETPPEDDLTLVAVRVLVQDAK